MKILICDDDKNIILQIRNLLNMICESRNLQFSISAFNCSNDAINTTQKFDIAFVDIEMPEINGLAVTQHLQELNPHIIIFIVTAFQGYLDDAMALSVFRYISKPIDKNRFIKNMNAAIEFYNKNTHSIIVGDDNVYHNIFTNDILYISIQNKKVIIVTKDITYLSSKNWSYWTDKLKKYDYFIQPHYSFIVNIKNIIDFDKNSVTLKAEPDKKINIPISRRYYSSFKQSFYSYMEATV